MAVKMVWMKLMIMARSREKRSLVPPKTSRMANQISSILEVELFLEAKKKNPKTQQNPQKDQHSEVE